MLLWKPPEVFGNLWRPPEVWGNFCCGGLPIRFLLRWRCDQIPNVAALLIDSFGGGLADKFFLWCPCELIPFVTDHKLFFEAGYIDSICDGIQFVSVCGRCHIDFLWQPCNSIPVVAAHK